jgi:hypothetical protein
MNPQDAARARAEYEANQARDEDARKPHPGQGWLLEIPADLAVRGPGGVPRHAVALGDTPRERPRDTDAARLDSLRSGWTGRTASTSCAWTGALCG